MREHRIMIDRDLARLYGVTTKVLAQTVGRNVTRFPDDFMFQLSAQEKHGLVTHCDRFETMTYSAQYNPE